MAEAFLTKNPIPQKKRKADGKNNTIARTQKTLTLSEDANLAAAVASVVRSSNSSDPRQTFLTPEKASGPVNNVPSGSQEVCCFPWWPRFHRKDTFERMGWEDCQLQCKPQCFKICNDFA